MEGTKRYIITAGIIIVLLFLNACSKGEVISEQGEADKPQGYIETPGFSKEVFVEGEYAYIVDGKWGIQVIDIRNREAPSLKSNLKTNWAWDFYLYGRYGLIADYAEGFVIADFDNIEEPEIVLKEDILVGASSLFVQDSVVYITDHSGQLIILDITEITNPVRLSVIQNIGWVYDIYVSQGYAYLLFRSAEDDREGLIIFDVNDPERPQISGTSLLEGTPNEITVLGDYAYIASSRYGVISVDISDKADPHEVFVLDTKDEATDIFMDNGYAYIADRQHGVMKASIEDDGRLAFIKSWEVPGYSDGVFLSEGYIYVVNYNGLVIIEDQ